MDTCAVGSKRVCWSDAANVRGKRVSVWGRRVTCRLLQPRHETHRRHSMNTPNTPSYSIPRPPAPITPLECPTHTRPPPLFLQKTHPACLAH